MEKWDTDSDSSDGSGEEVMVIIAKHMAAFGTPCAGSTSDVWSLRSCRDSFGCLRVSLVLDW